MYSKETYTLLIEYLKTYRLSLADYLILDELYSCCHMALADLRKRAVEAVKRVNGPKCEMRVISHRISVLKKRGYIGEVRPEILSAMETLMNAAAITPVGGGRAWDALGARRR